MLRGRHNAVAHALYARILGSVPGGETIPPACSHFTCCVCICISQHTNETAMDIDYLNTFASEDNYHDDDAPSPSPPPLHGLGKNLGINISSHRRSASAGSPASVSPSSPSPSPSMSSNIQERLFSRVLQQVLPSDYAVEDYKVMSKDKQKDTTRPPFSLTLMSTNFRRFNARLVLNLVSSEKIKHTILTFI